MFNHTSWFRLDDLVTFDPSFFRGCLRNKRDTIKKKSIPEEHFVFVKVSNDGSMSESNSAYARAKVLLSHEWVVQNIPSITQPDPAPLVQRPTKEYRRAPPLLELEEHEHFKDQQGQTVPVEVRGQRHEDKIYFKLGDVAKLLDMEHLDDVVTRERSAFTEEDYQTFLLDHRQKVGGRVEGGRRSIFLTYNGFIRVIYTSRSGYAKQYRKWATKLLFTNHLGSQDQREHQAIKMIGVPATTVKEVFDLCSVEVPCVYLFAIGHIVILRHYTPELRQPQFQTGMLFKFGRTNNIYRRMTEHVRTYGTLKGGRVCLVLWCPISPDLVSRAETHLKNSLKDKMIQFKNHKELVVLKNAERLELEGEFQEVFSRFGAANELKMQHKQLIIRMEGLKETVNYLNSHIDEMRLESQHQKNERQQSHRRHVDEVQDLKDMMKIMTMNHKREVDALTERIHELKLDKEALGSLLW